MGQIKIRTRLDFVGLRQEIITISCDCHNYSIKLENGIGNVIILACIIDVLG